MCPPSYFYTGTFSLIFRAACTILISACFVSGHLRVFNPQSGLTQIFRADNSCPAFSSKETISSTPGIRGEWMSYTPGPISLGYLKSAKASNSSICDRDVSMVMTSASIAAMCSMMSLNSL